MPLFFNFAVSQNSQLFVILCSWNNKLLWKLEQSMELVWQLFAAIAKGWVVEHWGNCHSLLRQYMSRSVWYSIYQNHLLNLSTNYLLGYSSGSGAIIQKEHLQSIYNTIITVCFPISDNQSYAEQFPGGPVTGCGQTIQGTRPAQQLVAVAPSRTQQLSNSL